MSARARKLLPLLGLAPVALARAATGGPDAGDMVYTDSAEADGPSHVWIDAADDSAYLGDTGTLAVSLPFVVSFYGTDYTTATVSADGTLAFAGTATTTCPSGAASWVGIQALGADLSGVTVTTATVGNYPDRSFVVSWTGIDRGGSDTGRVQVWLDEGRPEAVLVLDDLSFGSSAVDGGAGASIGVVGGTASTAYACAGGVADGTTVWFGEQGGRPARADVWTGDLDAPLSAGTTFAYPGRSLAVGDVNGDGTDDLLVGDQDNDLAWLVYQPTTIDNLDDADALFTSGDKLGAATLLADLDGDGAAEVLLGEAQDTTHHAVSFLTFSTPVAGTLGVADADGWVHTGSTGSLTPFVTLAAGDVDADGYPDLLAGDPTALLSNKGRVYLYDGGALPPYDQALGASAAATFDGDASSDRVGSALATADLDGDGAAELLFGLPYRDAGGSDAGGVAVLPGGTWSGSTDVLTTATCVITGTTAAARFGTALLAADLWGDGLADLVVGSPTDDPSVSDAGRVFVYADAALGCPTSATSADVTIAGTFAAGNLGASLAAADLDGDGVPDLVAGAPNATDGASSGGAAFVYRSAGSGLASASLTTSDADQELHGADSGGAFATAIAAGADGTLTLSAPYASITTSGDGAIYRYTYVPDFVDEDGDGFVDVAAGGNDCDDTEAGAFPGGTDPVGDDVDGDCDGWIDGTVRHRTDPDLWTWDLDLTGAVASTDVHDFEGDADGAALSTDGDYTWSAAGDVTTQADVSGSAAVGTAALQATGGTLHVELARPLDALHFRLLDPAGTFTLRAWSGSTLVAEHSFDASANNRPGGIDEGFVFAAEVDNFDLVSTDTLFGLDEVTPAWAEDSDRDGDGWSDAEGDCDDADAAISPSATEDLTNGIDDDCDGVVDGGSVTVTTSSAAWTAPSPSQTIDFEDRLSGEAITTQYQDLGVSFTSAFTAASSVDGTAATGTLAAKSTGFTAIVQFEEVQTSIAFTLLDADGLCTLKGSAAGYDLYTAHVAGTGGSQFVGLEFGYGVTQLKIVCPDTFGLDDLVTETVGAEDNDGDGLTEREGDCDDADATAYPGADETWYDGIDEDCGGDDDFDADGDGFDFGLDCDESSATVNPGETETWYDGVDEDCSGGSDFDVDGDGYDDIAWGGTDCDDASSTTNPGVTETWYDGIDEDCAGDDDYDADHDGFPGGAGSGATDCDDLNAAAHPGATEIWYDGIDEDCSGATRGDYDEDGDGHANQLYGGDDCDDTAADVYPSAPGELCYDGIDTDCDGADDYDCDGDGQSWNLWGGDDCDDTDPSIYLGAPDLPGDGIDSDCDGAPEFDADLDGYDDVAYGGTDCDDADAATHPGAVDVCYDGVDRDCAGDDDDDCDGDGDRPDAYGGGDCDDTDATRSSLVTDYPYDGIDQNCDGADDFDVDGDGVDAAWYGGTDCDDQDPAVRPGVSDACYDGVDSDCDGADDQDCDGDGVPVDADCDDGDATVYPGATELIGDGVDQDCDGSDLTACTDCDGDGFDAGVDCDDTDGAVYPGAVDVVYDGVDSDCGGGDDFDGDADGYDAALWGGTDCDDADASVHPGVTVDACGGGDEDCDGTVDEDCDTTDHDTGEPDDSGFTGDTDLPGGRDTASTSERPDPASVDEPTKVEDVNACGCATASPSGASLAALLLVAAASSKRRR